MINALKESLAIVDDTGEMKRRFFVWARNVVRDASVGDWIDVEFQNNWENESFGADFNDVQFRSIGNKQVQLRGVAVDGTVGQGTPVFTLPEGFRPILRYMFVAISDNALGRVDVRADGRVSVVLGSNVFVSLDGMVFSLD